MNVLALTILVSSCLAGIFICCFAAEYRRCRNKSLERDSLLPLNDAPEPQADRDMSDCAHCGTPFAATGSEDRLCCKGCEFVYDLIHDEGLDRYYTLRQDTPVKPVRSVPFETHDFTC